MSLAEDAVCAYDKFGKLESDVAWQAMVQASAGWLETRNGALAGFGRQELTDENHEIADLTMLKSGLYRHIEGWGDADCKEVPGFMGAGSAGWTECPAGYFIKGLWFQGKKASDIV